MRPAQSMTLPRTPHQAQSKRWVLALAMLPLGAWAAPPAVNLTVSLRHVDLARESTTTVTTGRAQSPLMTAQQVQVRNGGKAQFRMEQSIPVQWVSSASGYRSTTRGQNSVGAGTPGGAAATSAAQFEGRSEGGSFQQQTVWLPSGQSIVVQPQWPGGDAPVEVTVEVQQASTGPGVSSAAPRTSGSQVSTSLYAPLGQWVTLAATGGEATPGVVGTRSVREPPRALQVRVTRD